MADEIDDLIAVLRGSATAEAARRVTEALRDPGSRASASVAAIEAWGRRLPGCPGPAGVSHRRARLASWASRAWSRFAAALARPSVAGGVKPSAAEPRSEEAFTVIFSSAFEGGGRTPETTVDDLMAFTRGTADAAAEARVAAALRDPNSPVSAMLRPSAGAGEENG